MGWPDSCKTLAAASTALSLAGLAGRARGDWRGASLTSANRRAGEAPGLPGKNLRRGPAAVHRILELLRAYEEEKSLTGEAAVALVNAARIALLSLSVSRLALGRGIRSGQRCLHVMGNSLRRPGSIGTGRRPGPGRSQLFLRSTGSR